MAKLADAADLKSAGRKAVGVQIPLRAPIQSILYRDYLSPATTSKQCWCHLWCRFVPTMLASNQEDSFHAEKGGSQGAGSL